MILKDIMSPAKYLLEIEDSDTQERMVTDYEIWQSWIDKRYLAGVEFHGPIVDVFSKKKYTGPRVCGCKSCCE